jgi:hypothetical protein
MYSFQIPIQSTNPVQTSLILDNFEVREFTLGDGPVTAADLTNAFRLSPFGLIASVAKQGAATRKGMWLVGSVESPLDAVSGFAQLTSKVDALQMRPRKPQPTFGPSKEAHVTNNLFG